jgi:glycosyltransferase involved in cell wall biosynthesis
MKQKKICLILPSNKCGGMENVMITIAHYFATNNIDVHFVFLGKGNFYVLNEKIKVYYPKCGYKNKLYTTVKLLLFLRNTIRLINPYSILSFGEMYNSFVLLSCIGTKHRIFVSDRSKPNKDWGIFHNLLRKFIYKKATGIIAQTTFAKDFLFKETKNNNITIINNPIKTINCPSKIEDPRKNKILFVGRLIKSKRVDLLIEIFSQTANDSWVLQIVGDGNEREYLESKVREINLIDRIFFEGTQKNIDNYYLTSSIFAFTSNSEGFPNAIGEAMSAGLPIICFDCIAGPKDLVENEINGFLIENDDINDFKNKLSLLMSNYELRKSFGNASKIISKNFDAELISKKYLNVLLS